MRETQLAPEDGVAAIVVAYNGGDELLDCIHSLLAQTVRELEVIVVDNASTDGSIERAASAFGPRIRIVRRARNGGYAAGANAGWRATEAPIVAILNQDLILESDCVEQMRQVLVEQPGEVLVSPKLVLKSDPTQVNAVGNDVHLSGVTWCHGLGTAASDWHGVLEVTAISGAAFMASRAFLEQLGGLEESYFMYMEDVDLSLRTSLDGGRCLVACDAVAIHDWSLDLNPTKFGLLERNRRRLWRNVISDGGKRERVILAQAELLGWLYALRRGRAHVIAKAKGASGRRPSNPTLGGSRSGPRPSEPRLYGRLSNDLPYSTVVPGVRGVTSLGAVFDRIVARLAGIARSNPQQRPRTRVV
jgi:GT2 family glycosyltransferase